MSNRSDSLWSFRPILAPRDTLYSTEEFGKLFDLGPDTIRAAVAEGRLPGPRMVSKGVHKFTWEHAVFFRLLITLTPAEPRADKAKPSDN